VAVASYHHGYRSDSDSGRFLDVGLRCGARSGNICDLCVSSTWAENGAFRRVGGISVHTTYLTGMITSLVSTEAAKFTSELPPPAAGAPDPKIGLLSRIWIAFVFGAGTGAAMVFHFKALGMLGAALLLIALVLFNPSAS
jgi:uncharacterized membrane protein YoaK (UPF0700 family)